MPCKLDEKFVQATPSCDCCFDLMPHNFFATKILCNLFKARGICSHMWHLQLKNS